MNRIESLFARLTRAVVARPGRTLALYGLLLVLAGVTAATRLELRTSNLDLVDPTLPPVARFLGFANEFGTPNVIVIGLEGDAAPALQQAVQRLGAPLRAVPGVRAVVDRVPLEKRVLDELGLEEYLAAEDHRLYFILVQPADPSSRADALDPVMQGVKAALAGAGLAELGVRAGITGLPAYALDDRDIIKADINTLSTWSLVGIGLLFVIGFAGLRRPLLATLTLIVGVILTVGVAALVPGHLTLLSAFFATILFGLGIDYGIHVISRVEELMEGGRSERDVLPEAVAGVASGLLTGTVTTAAAFFALLCSGFRGFAELGLIAGLGVLICLLAAVTLLPALLARWGGRRPAAGRSARRSDAESHWIGRALWRAQHPVLAGLLILAALAGFFLTPPPFDADYLNLEPKGSEAVRLEREMVKRSSLSPQFAVFVRPDAESARTLANRLLAEDAVGEVRSIADLDALDAAARATIPEPYLHSLQSTNGRCAVYAYPQGNVWDPAEQAAFLAAVQKYDPEVTGMPVLGAFMVGESKRALVRGGLLGLLAVVACVLLDFRRLRPALLALTPTILTLAFLRGFMAVADVPFNALNVMAVPVIIGIAVDNGVHIVHRLRQEQGDLRRTVEGTGRSVLLTSATTLLAFGSLLFTRHCGLASFAVLMTAGVAAALIFSLGVLPILTRWTGVALDRPARRP